MSPLHTRDEHIYPSEPQPDPFGSTSRRRGLAAPGRSSRAAASACTGAGAGAGVGRLCARGCKLPLRPEWPRRRRHLLLRRLEQLGPRRRAWDVSRTCHGGVTVREDQGGLGEKIRAGRRRRQRRLAARRSRANGRRRRIGRGDCGSLACSLHRPLEACSHTRDAVKTPFTSQRRGAATPAPARMSRPMPWNQAAERAPAEEEAHRRSVSRDGARRRVAWGRAGERAPSPAMMLPMACPPRLVPNTSLSACGTNWSKSSRSYHRARPHVDVCMPLVGRGETPLQKQVERKIAPVLGRHRPQVHPPDPDLVIAISS